MFLDQDVNCLILVLYQIVKSQVKQLALNAYFTSSKPEEDDEHIQYNTSEDRVKKI